MKSSAVVIFVYPKAVLFLSRLIKSLNNQTIKPSKVIWFNDGVTNLESLLNDLEMDFEVIVVNGTPFQNRIQGFKILKSREFEYLILQDADDTSAPNRVEDAMVLLGQSSIVVHDLNIVSEEGLLITERIWKNRWLEHQSFTSFDIKDKNFIGLGNTSINKSLLNYLPEIGGDIQVADWFLFYHIMEQSKAVGVFSSVSCVNYYQHDENIVGLKKVTEQSLRNSLLCKKAHYETLIHFGYADFEERKDFVNYFLSKPIKQLQHESTFPYFWWEETKILDEKL